MCQRSFSIRDVSRKVYSPVVVVCFFNELRDFGFVCVPTLVYIVNIPFPGQWF